MPAVDGLFLEDARYSSRLLISTQPIRTFADGMHLRPPRAALDLFDEAHAGRRLLTE
jgi:hypothetical protein